MEVFQYEHILSFGAPLANTYKIVVDERELLFETSEVRQTVALKKQKNNAPFPEAFDQVVLFEHFSLRHGEAQYDGPYPASGPSQAEI